MIHALTIEGRSVTVDLDPGQHLLELAGGFWLFQGDIKTRVALHIDERRRAVDTIIELDEPVSATESGALLHHARSLDKGFERG